jgi:hypothetical protein
VFSGAQLSFKVTGLASAFQYQFRVRSVSEYLKNSLYSPVSVFYAAALPLAPQFPVTPFTNFNLNSFKLQWTQPTITLVMLPVDSYRVYWDAGYLLSGDFVLLDEVFAFNQNFLVIKNLTPGVLYKFQVSSVNAIGEGQLSGEVSHYSQSLPGKPLAPFRITSS